MKRIIALMLTVAMTAAVMVGCGSKEAQTTTDSKKTLVLGDTTFNAENEEGTIDPHEAYCGWATVRYGVGETLFKFSDEMELTPWIAESYENIDDLTWKITLKDGVTFSNGKAVDAEAVKSCFEDLVAVHERAAADLAIDTMEADGLTLTITTTEPKPTLMNYLCDPYGCIIDVASGNEGGIVVGTGPFVATELVTGDHVNLVKNDNYWNGDVKMDEIIVRTITDGDTLSMALQNGDIDAAYGMAYASYPLFENDNYTFSSAATSRAFYLQMNYNSDIMTDDAVREAIAMGIDKEGFVNTLLNGCGYVANGAFPDTFPFGEGVTGKSYDPDGAKAILEEAGWVDSDGDGIREKDGKTLSINWVTYPSRQELPLLAESAQATLKEIGIDVQLNITADHGTIVAEPTGWDVYGAAFVTAGIGDPMYFFSTNCLKDSPKNRGAYTSDELEALAAEMSSTYDVDKRNELAVQMQQQILDDDAFVFCSFLRMSIITKSNVTGLTAHPCDYYEITADLDVE